MYKKPLTLCLLLQLTQVGAQTGAAASALTEQDFLAEMPIVLSVSRLAQRLDETPGAMTIFDRNFIRMTGARDVVDVLRLVPGFQTTTSFETDAPMATYHGRYDDFANRIQVLVDGRSVYSGFLQGSAGVGWQTLALDDIERIEVLRGSNSAAYGARAFLGVVNIISRDVRETAGVAAKVTAGENGVVDVGTRVGWGDGTAMYRISADTRGDDGLRKVFPSTAPTDTASGTNRVSRVNFASHLSNGARGEVDVRVGAVEIAAVRGTTGPGNEGNLERLRYLGAQFLQMDWKMALSDDQDIAVTASLTHGFNNDGFPYLKPDLILGNSYYGTSIDFKAEEFNDAVSFQHTVRHTPTLRTVWGAEARQEQVKSRSSFDAREQVTSQFLRLFGNAEWRVWDAVVLNAGAMAESSDIGGDTFAPRVMVNWHVANGHTLRAGTSTAYRPPSAFEKYGNVKYYDVNGANPLPYVKASGRIVSEKVETQELGYSLNLAGGVSGDLRLFNEKITNGIGVIFAGYGPKGDFGNGDNSTITGGEYQLAWKPASSTQIFFSQTWTHIRVESLAFPDDIPKEGKPSNAWFKIAQGAPKYAASLTAMHTLPSGVNFTFMHQLAEAFITGSNNQDLFSMNRTDVRVGKFFRVGANKAELALTLQNLDVPYRDGDSKFFFDRRAMVSLQFEY